MRKWYKFWLEKKGFGIVYEPPRRTFNAQKKWGGYEENDSYKDKEVFWNKYFQGRYIDYEDFLKKHLSKNDEILSIASGRCVNETRLLDENYNVTCSDLQIIPAFEATKKLFGRFNFIELDILKAAPPKKYDKIICLSLIYLFDDEELETFFKHINQGLKAEGHLLLDSAGSEDNLLSFIIHDLYLKFESYFRLFVGRLFGKKYQLVKHEIGYRRTDQEIIAFAEKNNLIHISQNNYGFLTEFQRSYFLNILINRSKTIRQILTKIGHHVPYIRMFNFKKL